MPMNGRCVSVCIPAKDEAETIEEIITRCRPHADELFVVDGHSKDATRDLADALEVPVYLDAGRGKGCAVREAIARTTGDILVTIDADMSFDPEDIPALVAPVANGEADYSTGSRMRGGSDELHGDFDKFLRMMGQDIITLGINYRFGVRLTDSQSGFRGLRPGRREVDHAERGHYDHGTGNDHQVPAHGVPGGGGTDPRVRQPA